MFNLVPRTFTLPEREDPQVFIERLRKTYDFELFAGPFFKDGHNHWNRGYFIVTLPHLPAPLNANRYRITFWSRSIRGTYKLGDGMAHLLKYGIPVKYPHKDCPAGDTWGSRESVKD